MSRIDRRRCASGVVGFISSVLAATLASGGALAHRLLALQVDLVRAVNEAIHDGVGQRGLADDFMMPPFSIA